MVPYCNWHDSWFSGPSWEERCFGEKTCESCEISGREKHIKVIKNLYECKMACMNDPRCLGIDFGKKGRDSECYHNYEYVERIGRENFDAWSKRNELGCNYRKFGM